MDENKLDLIFKAYDVRGVFNETITPQVGFKIGAAFASYVDSNEESDVTLTSARKEYRIFLRDLPQNYESANDAADAWAAYVIPE